MRIRNYQPNLLSPAFASIVRRELGDLLMQIGLDKDHNMSKVVCACMITSFVVSTSSEWQVITRTSIFSASVEPFAASYMIFHQFYDCTFENGIYNIETCVKQDRGFFRGL